MSGQETAPLRGLYANYIKRVFDIACVLAAAPVVVPVIAVLAALIRLDGGNPFYSQSRVGRGGKHFRCWKLRSMVVDADDRLEAYLEANPKARIEWDRDQKLQNDPRVTWLGRFIRKSSVDELPQLWNVLKGDMSLVGPRPFMPEQQDLYPGRHYYRLRPGLTGLWQVSDRNKSTFARRAVYDNRYAGDISLVTDMSIIVRTVGVVIRATGH